MRPIPTVSRLRERLRARRSTRFPPRGILWHRVQTVALDPFRFQRLQGGLTWGAGQLTLTVVGRTRRRVRVVETVTVPLRDASPEALIQALTAVRRQCSGYLPPVILGLDSTVVGYRLLILPDPVPADLPAWVVAQATSLVPPGLRLTALTLDYRVVRTADRSAVQVVWAWRERLSHLVTTVEQAGFRVGGVSPEALAVLDALPYRADGIAPFILVTPEAVTLVPLANGLPQHLQEIAWMDSDAETDWSGVAARLRALLPAPCCSLTLVTPGPSPTDPGAALAEALAQQGIDVTPTAGPSSGATAVAQVGLEPTHPPFQLLPPNPNAGGHDDQDRRWALRLGWGGGLLLALVLVVGLLLHGSSARAHRRLAADLASKTAWIAEVRMLTDTEQRVAADLARLRALRASPADVVGFLDTLGRTVPEPLWLRTVQVERQAATGRYQAHLTGFARTEAALGAFLARLEREARWRPRGTFTTTRWEPGRVQQQMSVRIPLIHFDLQVVTTASGH